MKKLTVIAVFTLLLTTVLSAAKNMAVMPFEIVGNAVTEAEAEGITELYISELVSTGKISIVDRANFDKILKEMNFQNSDWSNSEKTAKLGQATNAQFISRGKIIKLGSKMYLSSTVIDVTTAKVVSSGRKEFEDIDAAFAILSGFAKEVVDGMTYKIGDTGPGGGTIFRIEGTTVYAGGILSDASLYSAIEIASSYIGGGYTGWSLPDRKEFEWIFKLSVFREHNKRGVYNYYWTREEWNNTQGLCYTPDNWPTVSISEKTSKLGVCLVRKFIQE